MPNKQGRSYALELEVHRSVGVDSQAGRQHGFAMLGRRRLGRCKGRSEQPLVGTPRGRRGDGCGVGVVLRAHPSDSDRQTIEAHDGDHGNDGDDAREPAEDDVAPFGRATLARAYPQAGLQLRHLDRYVGARDACLEPDRLWLRPFAAWQCTRLA